MGSNPCLVVFLGANLLKQMPHRRGDVSHKSAMPEEKYATIVSLVIDELLSSLSEALRKRT